MRGIAWLKNLWGGRELDKELDDELRGYVELLSDEYRARGYGPEAAFRAARIEAGAIEPVKEQVRDARSGATTVASHDHGVQYFRERQVDGIVGAQVVSKLPSAIEKRLVGMALQVQSAKVFQGPRSARLCGIAEAFAKTGEIMPLVRVVGHRRADGDAFDDQGRLARTAALLRGTAWLVPRGVYLFSSFDEAEAWMTETILRTRERLSQRTSSGSAGR